MLTPMPGPVLQTYTDADHQKQRPIMIHRAIFGSIERFFGILVENCGGAFPLWLAPVQCKILPITDAFVGYANEVADKMRDAGIRVEVSSGGCSPPLILSRSANVCRASASRVRSDCSARVSCSNHPGLSRQEQLRENCSASMHLDSTSITADRAGL